MFIKILPIVFDKYLKIFDPIRSIGYRKPNFLDFISNWIFTDRAPNGEFGYYTEYRTYKTLNENNLTVITSVMFVDTDHISNYEIDWRYIDNEGNPTKMKIIRLSLSSGDKIEFFPIDQSDETRLDLSNINVLN